MISSPGRRTTPAWPVSERPSATRLSDSVVPELNTSSCAGPAPTKRFNCARACSKASVARWLSVCTPRWMLARLRSSKPAIASSTARGMCVVAALSR
jgi:hypothetical protein